MKPQKQSILINDDHYFVKDLGVTDNVRNIPKGWRLPTIEEGWDLSSKVIWTKGGLYDYLHDRKSGGIWGNLFVIRPNYVKSTLHFELIIMLVSLVLLVIIYFF